jgi:hypothetical protein
MLRTIFQYIYFFSTSIWWYGTACYVVVVLVWFILGAVINPLVYLPYATAASSFILFVLTKYSELRDLRTEFQSHITKIVDDNFKSIVESSNIIGFGFDASAVLSGIKSSSGRIKETVLNVQSTTVRELLGNSDFTDGIVSIIANLDPEKITRIFYGDVKAIEEMALQFKFDPSVAKIIVGIGKRDQDMVEKALMEICSKNNAHVPTELALIFFKIASSDDKVSSSRTAAKDLISYLMNDAEIRGIVSEQLQKIPKSGVVGEFKVGFAEEQKYIQELLDVFECIAALATGDPGPLSTLANRAESITWLPKGMSSYFFWIVTLFGRWQDRKNNPQEFQSAIIKIFTDFFHIPEELIRHLTALLEAAAGSNIEQRLEVLKLVCLKLGLPKRNVPFLQLVAAMNMSDELIVRNLVFNGTLTTNIF